MTLCVAVECSHKGHSRYVFAKDFKVETGISSAEIEAKYTWIGKVEYPALFAGSGSRGIELADMIGNWLDSDQSTGQTFSEIARHGVMELKHAIANEYVGALLGITWDRILAEGSSILPPEKHREVVDDVSRLQIGCSLLWLAFGERGTHLIRVSEEGMAEQCSHFGAIGSGTYVAESSLFYREHKSDTPLGTAIYNVYEAMKLGAKAPGVGEKFSIHIVSADDDPENVTWDEITEEYYKHLEKQFAKHGPKKTGELRYKSRWIERTYSTMQSTSQRSEPEP